MMNRRDILAALPAVAFAPRAVSAADVPDPILPLYRQWQEARAEWHALADLPGNENWDSAATVEADARENAAFWAMLDMTPVTMEGVAALAHVLWTLEGPSPPPGTADYEESLTQPANRIMAALWRAGGATSLL